MDNSFNSIEYPWDRQIRVRGVETAGQVRLESAKILIAGVGAIGSNIVETLGRMNVCRNGKIILLDKDKVTDSNISRYGLLTFNDVGKLKVEVISKRLIAINDQYKIDENLVPISENVFDISLERMSDIISDVDLVILSFDSFPPRFHLAELCTKLEKPYIYAGIDSMTLAIQTYLPHDDWPCLGCNDFIIERSQPSEDEVACRRDPNIATIARIAGDLTVIEVLKIINPGMGDPIKHFLLYNGRYNAFSVIELDRKPDCEICGTGKTLMFQSMDKYISSIQEQQRESIEWAENKVKHELKIKLNATKYEAEKIVELIKLYVNGLSRKEKPQTG